jgi:acyl-CoA reductase-like NAD-dependent aldehyde dehydrogenase
VVDDGRLFIGEWVAPSTDARIDVVSPHTEAVIGEAAGAGPEDIARAVIAARAAVDAGPWPRMDPADRIAAVRRLAALYGERRREMAALITAEMGSPISFSKLAQAMLPWTMLGAFADFAEGFIWEATRPGYYGQDVILRKEPAGVVAAVVPWNMPQFLIVGKLAPALLAGCAVVLKPAPETPLDANLLAEMIEQAGLPPGVVSVLPGGADVGARLVVGGTDMPAGVDRGWYVRPTLFADVDNRMRIAQEEIFGPVLTVVPYAGDDDAARIADESDYGLSGSVWTADVDRGMEVARRVRTGTFGVNQPYSMDPAAPFGGVKASGVGRELGREGLDEYLEVKAISVAPATDLSEGRDR